MDLNKRVFKYLVYVPVCYLRFQNVPLYLSRLKKSQYFPRDTLESLQLRKLRKLIRYAKKYVPGYRSRFRYVEPGDLKSLEDIILLPTISKEDLKYRNIMSTKPSILLTKKTTGGSTGQPVTILKTPNSMALELAATWRGYSWAGIDIGDRQARFWGVPLSKKDRLKAQLIDFVCNRKRLSAFNFDEADMELYTKKLVSFNPRYFYGYVSMLEEYARFFLRKGTRPPFDLKCIIATSEELTTQHRQLFQHVFSTRVFNEYGCGEVGSIAHECECGSMHVMAENIIVEILNGEKPSEPGEIGEIVVTELNNKAMPLIRYRTGDYGSLSFKKCVCGRELPVLEEVLGRAYDLIKNKQGKLFHGELFMYIFEESERKGLGIKRFQVIQQDLSQLLIKIVPDEGFRKEAKEFISRKVQQLMGHEVTIRFKEVEYIPREKSGKMRVVVGMRQNKSTNNPRFDAGYQ